MQYGVTLPDVEARTLAELALEAEAAGWDGVFVWDMIWGTDAWVSLAAAAMLTSRVRLGRGRRDLVVGKCLARPGNAERTGGHARPRQTGAAMLGEGITRQAIVISVR